MTAKHQSMTGFGPGAIAGESAYTLTKQIDPLGPEYITIIEPGGVLYDQLDWANFDPEGLSTNVYGNQSNKKVHAGFPLEPYLNQILDGIV